MKRGFQGAPRPLLPSMLLVAINPNAGQEHAAQAQSQPSSSSPTAPTPPPITTPTPPPITTPTPPPITTPPPPPILTPTPPPIRTSPPPPIPTPTPPPISPPTSPPPPPETEPTPDEYIYKDQSPVHHHFSPSQEKATSRMPMDDLLQAIPKSIDKKEYKKEKRLKVKSKSQAWTFKKLMPWAEKSIRCAEKIKLLLLSKIVTAVKIRTKRRKAPMRREETPKEVKGTNLQEQASLAEAIRLNSYKKKEAKQIHLMLLLAQKLQEEEELTDNSKKKKLNFEATKASLKRFGEELQTKTLKRLKEEKDDESKEDEPTKKSGRRRKQMARKGMHTSVDKHILKSQLNCEQEESTQKEFWNCLRIMFEEPLSTDSIWSELGQQKIIRWRYYDTCRVHCLNLESMEVYMLSERKYPLSAESKRLAGKELSNPFIADDLLKIKVQDNPLKPKVKLKVFKDQECFEGTLKFLMKIKLGEDLFRKILKQTNTVSIKLRLYL
ncbi:hypothetical protein Tco_0084810 [Tanacetum coccineum]